MAASAVAPPAMRMLPSGRAAATCPVLGSGRNATIMDDPVAGSNTSISEDTRPIGRDPACNEHAPVLQQSRGVVHPSVGEPSRCDRGIVDRIVNDDRIRERSVRQLASSDQCSLVR